MENNFKIPTSDEKFIYGTLNSVKSKRVIIFVHGLTGSPNEHQYYNAVPYFNSRDYDVVRFRFYNKKNDARNLTECSISIHAHDLNVIINEFKEKYEELYLVGHSLGCPVIINANMLLIKKIIFWDPSRGMKSLEDRKAVFDSKTKLYTLNWHISFTINQKMVDEWKENANILEYSKKIKGDCYFIFAENYNSYSAWKNYVKDYPCFVIPGASHVFIEEGVEKILFDKTLEYLEK